MELTATGVASAGSTVGRASGDSRELRRYLPQATRTALALSTRPDNDDAPFQPLAPWPLLPTHRRVVAVVTTHRWNGQADERAGGWPAGWMDSVRGAQRTKASAAPSLPLPSLGATVRGARGSATPRERDRPRRDPARGARRCAARECATPTTPTPTWRPRGRAPPEAKDWPIAREDTPLTRHPGGTIRVRALPLTRRRAASTTGG
eukprot:scaffold1819_cov311-Prasinococcus_capsulatus_cf.AAC.6